MKAMALNKQSPIEERKADTEPADNQILTTTHRINRWAYGLFVKVSVCGACHTDPPAADQGRIKLDKLPRIKCGAGMTNNKQTFSTEHF